MTKAEDADAYLRYVQETGFKAFRETAGNVGALGLRRIVDGRAEFVVISFWESKDVIHNFAGDDIDRAVFYPEDDRFLVERDLHVDHYEVVHRDEQARVG